MWAPKGRKTVTENWQLHWLQFLETYVTLHIVNINFNDCLNREFLYCSNCRSWYKTLWVWSIDGWEWMISENGGSLPATSFHNNVRVLTRINSRRRASGEKWFSRVSLVLQSCSTDCFLHDVSNGARPECTERWMKHNEHRCSRERAVSLRARYVRLQLWF